MLKFINKKQDKFNSLFYVMILLSILICSITFIDSAFILFIVYGIITWFLASTYKKNKWQIARINGFDSSSSDVEFISGKCFKNKSYNIVLEKYDIILLLVLIYSIPLSHNHVANLFINAAIIWILVGVYKKNRSICNLAADCNENIDMSTTTTETKSVNSIKNTFQMVWCKDVENNVNLCCNLIAYKNVHISENCNDNNIQNVQFYDEVQSKPDGKSGIFMAILKEDSSKPDNDISCVVLTKEMELVPSADNSCRVLSCSLNADEFKMMNEMAENIKINFYKNSVEPQNLVGCYCEKIPDITL